MNWTFRTLLRVFLLVGGGFFLVTGLLGGNLLETLIGAAGVVLGATGLATELRGDDEE